MVEAPNIGINIEPRKFPQGFRWGSATAPFQVEGSSGIRKTDWDFFIARENIVSPDEKTPNHWIKGNAEQDFQSMKDVGLNAQRFGFEWGRIEPEQGKISKEALRRYREVVDFLKDKGITPMITANHFVLPEWVARQGGWENKSIREAFRHYAEVLADNFPDVPYWITINEPNVLATAGYVGGVWPPGKKGMSGLLTALHSVSPNMIAAHELAGNELHKQGGKKEKVQVGIANQIIWFRPERENSRLDKIPGKIADALYNYKFLKGTIENSDFMGVNFYSGYWLKFRPEFNGKMRDGLPMTIDELPFGKVVNHNDEILSEVGWPVVPGFFLEALQYAYSKFKKPVIITENGIADREDKLRSFYTLTHLIALQEAIKRGVDVRGYFHWSTTDNLEWEKGFGSRFGLIAHDPKTGERAIRQSAKMYGEIATANEIDINKLEKYLTPEQKELTRKFLQSLK